MSQRVDRLKAWNALSILTLTLIGALFSPTVGNANPLSAGEYHS